MQFNEFNRTLDASNADPKVKFLLVHMFEVQMEFSRALDSMTTLLGQLIDRMHDVSLINEHMIVALKELRRRNQVDGVEVHSVRNDPDEKD